MKRTLKTISAALLAAVMCASFSGCKSDEQKVMDALDALDKEIAKEFGENGGASTSSKPEPKPIDPFDGLEVTFEGIAPKVTAEIKGRNSNCRYTLSKDRELKNGDKVTLTAEIANLVKDSYVLTSDSKEFTVSDRPYYIMQLSDLTDEDVRKLDQKITDMIPEDIKSHTGGGKDSTINALDFLGIINLTKNNGNYRLYFVYKANVTFAKAGETAEYIFAAYYSHIYKDKDGTLIFEDGKPGYAGSGDMSLTINGYYVGGAYESVDSLYAQLSGFGAERESNVEEHNS